MAVQVWQSKLARLTDLELFTRSAEQTTFQGRPALRLDGLALVPGLQLLDGCIEVTIAAEGPCYPGIAFALRDNANYELAYAVPQCSGQVDAIQYDPVFHGSNTWQLYNGPGYQQQAILPTGEWFTLRLHLHGGRASMQVNDQPPLVVDQLAHPHLPGRVGVWTYLPAFFTGLRVTSNGHPVGLSALVPALPPGTVDGWFMEGYGALDVESSGILNLNRRFPVGLGQVTLVRRFQLLSPCKVIFGLGFSDELSLEVDGQPCFQGVNLWQGFASLAERGWVAPGAHSAALPLTAGTHELKACLKVTEGFGWGLTLTAEPSGPHPGVPGAAALRWLPAVRG